MSGANEGPDPLARIEILVSLGRHQEALNALAPITAREPESSYAWCLTAQAQLQLDRPEEARRSAEAAARADPSAEWPLRLLSIALRETGEGVPAVETAMESVRMEPNLWEPRAILALALLEVRGAEVKGARHRARRVAETAVGIAPDEPQTHFVLGLVADRLGRQGDAENAYRRALRLDPQHAAARNNLSVILSRRGDFIGAARGFTEAAAGDPQLSIARRNVDHVVIRMVQRAHLVVLAATFAAIAGPRLLGVDSRVVSFLAAMAGVGVVSWWVVRFRTSTPRRLHRYLKTLPARDKLVTAWVTLLVVALLLLCVASLLSRDARTWGFALAFVAVVLASVLSYLHATRGKGRTRRTFRS
jgi:Flp pilus assembly protein TadD